MPNWKYIRYDIQERWERLELRKWVNKNPKIVVGITVACVFIFLLFVIALLKPRGYAMVLQTKKSWFYDLNTGELFAADSDSIPPINTPSGKLANGAPAGVRAYVFSYIKDSNESEQFIGYLEKYTPEGRKITSYFQKPRDNVTKDLIRRLEKNRLIRRVDDESWFPANSSQGQTIVAEFFQPNKNGKVAIYCPLK